MNGSYCYYKVETLKNVIKEAIDELYRRFDYEEDIHNVRREIIDIIWFGADNRCKELSNS